MSDEDEGNAHRRMIHAVGGDGDSRMLSTNPIVANLAEMSNKSEQSSDDEDDASMILPTPEKLTISSKLTLLDADRSEKCSVFEKFKVQKEVNFTDDGVEQRDSVQVPTKEQGQAAGTSDFKSPSPRPYPSVDFSQPKATYEGSQEDDDWNLHLSSSLTCTNATQEESTESKHMDNVKVSPPLLLQEIFSNVPSSQNSHNGDSEPDLPPTQRNPDLLMDSLNNSDYSDEDEIAPSQEPTQPLLNIHDPLVPFGRGLFKSRSPLARIHKEAMNEPMEISESCNLSDTVDLTEVPETQEMELEDNRDMNESTGNQSITEVQESKYIKEIEDDYNAAGIKESHGIIDAGDHSVSVDKEGQNVIEDKNDHSVIVMEVDDRVAEDDESFNVIAAAVKRELKIAENEDNLSVATVKEDLSIDEDKDNLHVATAKEDNSIAKDDHSIAIVDHSVKDKSCNVTVKDIDLLDNDQNFDAVEREHGFSKFQGDAEQQEIKELPETVALIPSSETIQKDELMETLEVGLKKFQEAMGTYQKDELTKLQETEKIDEGNKFKEAVVKKVDKSNKFQVTMKVNKIDELQKISKDSKMDEEHEFPETIEMNEGDVVNELPETVEMNKGDVVDELPETVEMVRGDVVDELPETVEMIRGDVVDELPETVEMIRGDVVDELPETVEMIRGDVVELPETVEMIRGDVVDELPETVEMIRGYVATEFPETVEMIKEDVVTELPETVEISRIDKLHEIMDLNKIDEINKFQETLDTNGIELNELPETVEINRVDELKGSQEIMQKCKMNEVKELQETMEMKKMEELPETVLLETNKDEKSSVEAKSTIGDSTSKKGVDEEVQVLFPLPCTIKKLKQLNELPKKSLGAMGDTFSSDDTPNMSKEVPFIKSTDSTPCVPVHTVGTFTSLNDLNMLLKSLDLSMDEEKFEYFSNPSGDSKEHVIFRGMATYKIVIKDKTVFQKFIPLGHGKVIENLSEVEVSPADSNSTTLSAKVSSFGSTPSGEMGDISSSISSKSSSSHSSISASQSNLRKSVLSQETLMDTLAIKTSTQKSDAVGVSFKSTGIFDASESDINRRNQETGIFVQDALSKLQSDDKIFRSPSVLLPPIKGFSKSSTFKSGVVSSKLRRGRKRKEQKNSLSTSVSDNYEKPAKKPRGGKSDADQNSFSPMSIQISDENSDFLKRTLYGSRKKSTNKSTAIGRKHDSEKELIEIFDDSFDTESDSAPFGIILPGVRVMARWKDGYYYPAVVKSQESEGRWWIHFDDGSLRSVTEKNLLKISILQVGTDVLAQTSPDGFYDPGTVKSHFREGTQYGYVIEHETGLTKRYSRSSVILSTEQAKIITGIRPVAPPSSTINLENIIGGKRKRKSASESEKGMGKGDSNLESTESSMSESLLPEKNIVGKVKSNRKKGGRQKYAKSNTSRNRAAISHVTHNKIPTSSDISSSDVADDKEISEQKIRKSKIFIGYAFILSNAVRSSTTKGEMDSSSADSVSAETCDEPQPFDKEYLCKEILAGGGIVLETFEEALKSKRKVFLLASTYLRTIKYIRCIAVNIPCITHHWIYNCCYTKTLQDHHPYLLPTGLSIIENAIVEWHNKTNIFQGMKIVLTAEKKSDFVSIWTPVLLSASADLVQKWNLPSFSVPGMSFSVDLIITNTSCPSNVIAAAKRRKLPIVSSEWMIQSIIEGKLLAYDAHPKFRHDYKA